MIIITIPSKYSNKTEYLSEENGKIVKFNNKTEAINHLLKSRTKQVKINLPQIL